MRNLVFDAYVSGVIQQEEQAERKHSSRGFGGGASGTS